LAPSTPFNPKVDFLTGLNFSLSFSSGCGFGGGVEEDMKDILLLAKLLLPLSNEDGLGGRAGDLG